MSEKPPAWMAGWYIETTLLPKEIYSLKVETSFVWLAKINTWERRLSQCNIAVIEYTTEYIIRVPDQGLDMTRQHPGHHEASRENLPYQSNGSSGTSEICWSTRSPDGATNIFSSESGDNILSTLEDNTSQRHCSSRSDSGELLESQRRLHNNGNSRPSDRSQNCHLHIG